MNEQIVLVLVLLYFNLDFKPKHKIKYSIFSIYAPNNSHLNRLTLVTYHLTFQRSN
jgi:hypothetical protein